MEYGGENAGDGAGWQVAESADMDGDGFADFIIGAYGNADGGAYAGAAYLVFGDTTPASTSLGTAMEFVGEAANDYAGLGAAGGDVDGDGTPDLLIGAPYSDAASVDAGATYLILGKSGGI